MIEAMELSKLRLSDVLKRRELASREIESDVFKIIEDVRTRGDAALYEYTERFDRVKLSSLEVSTEELDAATEQIGARLLGALERAAKNIRAYHSRQICDGFELDERESRGVLLGQKYTPIGSAGVYVPGGTAYYPSSVLMNLIPASIAGVERRLMTSPPSFNGSIAPGILAAAKLAGATTVLKLGGAQAIAALAYGTESIPRVNKITGPGNRYVAAAKRLVYGTVDIDMIAGPSEILVIADESADPAFVAADLLSQAEHDENASAVLITVSRTLAAQVAAELSRQTALLPRRCICETSLKNNGMILLARDMDEAIDAANELAPEHIELCVKEPLALLGKVKNAGSIFMGHYSPEALGDYIAGTNHVLPTNGAAKFSSPLSVYDFVKRSSYMYYSRDALCDVMEDIETIANEEGLFAHARSVTIRFDDEKGGRIS